MQTWVIYGILASFFWGSYIIAAKVAQKNFNIKPAYISLFMLIGIALVFIGNILYEGKFAMPTNTFGIGFGILAGILWALGMVVSLKALSMTDASRLTPLFNTNTLVAVLLGVILLHELPTAGELARVVIGAVLIVIGTVLVSF